MRQDKIIHEYHFPVLIASRYRKTGANEAKGNGYAEIGDKIY